METLVKDIRYGLRSLLKHPAFTAIVVVTLAVGIGASSAIFSVVNTALLRPLPYARAERIVAIQELTQDGKRVQVTPANFLDWRAQNTVFEQLAAILTRPANLALADQAERIDLAMTSANFFSVFGTEPEHGRLFIPSDEQAGHAPIVVVSHGLWQRRFGGEASLVGKPITLDGVSYTVVGIAPAGFQYPDKTDVWVPPFKLAPTLNERMDPTQVRGFGMLSAVALRKPGVSLTQAASEMETITARLRQQYPDTNNRRFNRVVSLHTHLVGETGSILLLLFGAVSFVLLIACANVANLLLASAATRQKEMAIRTALGASRLRMMRQLLTESLMLAFAGGAIGLLLALWGVALMTKLLPRDFPRLGEISLDWRVLGFTLVASVLTGILFGLAPALQISKTDVRESLKESGRGASSSRRHNRLRNLLIVQQQLLERLRASAQVRSASFAEWVPLGIGGSKSGLYVEGKATRTDQLDEKSLLDYTTVATDYFKTMGIPLVRGRDFDDRDTASNTAVVIVNETLARHLAPDGNAVGKRLRMDSKSDYLEVVGVTRDIKYHQLAEAPLFFGYMPLSQRYRSALTLHVRTVGDPSAVINQVRSEVKALDPDLPLTNLKTMQEHMRLPLAPAKLFASLSSGFGVLTLLLAAIGLYGVMAFLVGSRTHEIGIRMALGAQTGGIRKLIIGQGMRLALTGIALGLIAAFALTRVLASLLYGVSATDPLTFIGVAVLLAGVAMLACYLPARRATKVDPLVALRYE